MAQIASDIIQFAQSEYCPGEIAIHMRMSDPGFWRVNVKSCGKYIEVALHRDTQIPIDDLFFEAQRMYKEILGKVNKLAHCKNCGHAINLHCRDKGCIMPNHCIVFKCRCGYKKIIRKGIDSKKGV